MPSLHIHNIPDTLYSRIRNLAQKKNRSLSAEVIGLLERAISEEERRADVPKILAAIRRHRFTPEPGTPYSVELIREDRCR